jgi:FRG domain
MAWPNVIVDSWDHFLYFSSRVTDSPPFTTAYLLRGQADADWPLKPSLLRQIKQEINAENAVAIEGQAWREFVSQAHHHISSYILRSISTYIEWLSLMQHHNAPTRLLDWTSSPFVAAYFAVEQLWNKDGAIWLFHPATLKNQMKIKFGEVYDQKDSVLSNYMSKPDAVQAIKPWLPNFKSDRMIAQQGQFTLCFNILGDQEAIIDEACCPIHEENKHEAYKKVVIPKELKPVFLRNLHSMNVTANALFPGVDGLGRSIAELTRLTTYFPNDQPGG